MMAKPSISAFLESKRNRKCCKLGNFYVFPAAGFTLCASRGATDISTYLPLNPSVVFVILCKTVMKRKLKIVLTSPYTFIIH